MWDSQSTATATIILHLVEEMLLNPRVNLEEWARHLQITLEILRISPSNSAGIAGYEESLQIPSNPETEGVEGSREEEREEGEEWGGGDEIPYFEVFEPPQSEASSDNEDENIPDGMQCPICERRQKAVQFPACSHATCKNCLMGIYHSRRNSELHYPLWIPCPLCRAETWVVGRLSLQDDFYGTAVQFEIHGGQQFTIWNWVPLRRWVAKRSRTVAEGLMDKAILARHSASSATSISDDAPNIYVEGRLGAN